MSVRLTSLERAFELARSGECRGAHEIRQRLYAEGLDPRQIEGAALLRQLREISAKARRDAGIVDPA